MRFLEARVRGEGRGCGLAVGMGEVGEDGVRVWWLRNHSRVSELKKLLNTVGNRNAIPNQTADSIKLT